MARDFALAVEGLSVQTDPGDDVDRAIALLAEAGFHAYKVHHSLIDPPDPGSRVNVTVNRGVNQDSWTVLVTKAEFDRESQEWKQFYAFDFEWKPYQGFDLLDVSNVSFTGARVEVITPDVRKFARPNVVRPQED